MIKSHLLTLLCVISLLGFKLNSTAQISVKGLPLSLSIPDSLLNNIDIVTISPPEIDTTLPVDYLEGKNGNPLKVGVSLATNLNTTNSGTWTTLDDGNKIWQLKIISPMAKAICICYDEFSIPEGGKLFLYNENKSQIIGAFTHINNPECKLFSNELIQGESVTLEYISPDSLAPPILNISQIAYIYRKVSFLKYFEVPKTTGWGNSQFCEINVSCSPTGDQWQEAKRGVALIMILDQNNWYFCTGSLINNTALDKKPYFLTASHCGGNSASESEIAQWQFYFNYESADCTTPLSEPAYNTIIGAKRIAVGSIEGGSDFLLLELNTIPPEYFKPYYNGWDNSNDAASSGVCIHHPGGDIKKISTFSTSIISSSPIIGVNQMASNSSWKVYWSENVNGWGVTEGGSSGSPLFNKDRQIIGTLSGGLAYCFYQTEPDYYGKFWYHWDQNTNSSNNKLKEWLDPIGSNINKMGGWDPYLPLIPQADFTSNATEICNNQNIDFQDRSTNDPTSWDWTFFGGTPAKSYIKNPSNIKYYTPGIYKVELTASNKSGTNKRIKENYITVNPLPKIELGTNKTICIGDSLKLTATGGSYYLWNTNETNSSIIVSPKTTSVYSVAATDHKGCTAHDKVLVTVSPPAIAGFEYYTERLEVTFNNLSLNASTIIWDFGDGTSSSYSNPIHEYAFEGKYLIKQIVSNICREDSVIKELNLSSVSINTDNTSDYINIYPNPTSGSFFIKYNSDNRDNINIEMYDLEGKIVYNNYLMNLGKDRLYNIDINHLAKGNYILKISYEYRVLSRIISLN